MNDWQNALDNAQEAAERGFPVFPLSRNKVPAIASPHDRGHACRGVCGQFGHGVHDATTDPRRLRQLFDAAPRAAGYGVACGSGEEPMIGLDLDRKNGEDGVAELNRLCQKLDFKIPRTLTVCTPSGGFHLWFTGPRGTTVPNSVRRVAPGIDVRGTAGYLVGPGSAGKGGRYVIHPRLRDADVMPVPDPLLCLMLPPPRVTLPRQPLRAADGGTALMGLVRTVLEAQQGTRNDRLFWAACRGYEHVQAGRLDGSAVEAALVRAALDVGLTENAAKNTVASARGKSTGAAL